MAPRGAYWRALLYVMAPKPVLQCENYDDFVTTTICEGFNQREMAHIDAMVAQTLGNGGKDKLVAHRAPTIIQICYAAMNK